MTQVDAVACIVHETCPLSHQRSLGACNPLRSRQQACRIFQVFTSERRELSSVMDAVQQQAWCRQWLSVAYRQRIRGRWDCKPGEGTARLDF